LKVRIGGSPVLVKISRELESKQGEKGPGKKSERNHWIAHGRKSICPEERGSENILRGKHARRGASRHRGQLGLRSSSRGARLNQAREVRDSLKRAFKGYRGGSTCFRGVKHDLDEGLCLKGVKGGGICVLRTGRLNGKKSSLHFVLPRKLYKEVPAKTAQRDVRVTPLGVKEMYRGIKKSLGRSKTKEYDSSGEQLARNSGITSNERKDKM